MRETEPEGPCEYHKILQTGWGSTEVQKTLRRLSIWLGFIALGCYVLLGAAFLGVRYWVLPNIDNWREPLQRELSGILPVQVELGRVEAQWRGRHPRISLRDAVLRDDKGQLLLKIPAVDAMVAWSSLFTGTPRFLELRADGVELSVRRDRHDRISLVGYEVETSGEGDARGDSAVLQWLSRQSNVRFTNTRILWSDEQRGAPPLELRDVALGLGAVNGEHVFSVVARPPAALGASFMLQGRMRAKLQEDRPFSLADVSGLFHVSVEDMRPAGWQPWLDVHSVLEEGRVSWRGWQEVVDGVARRHVSQVAVEEGVWHPDPAVGIKAASARLYLAGEWAALQRIWSGDDEPQDHAPDGSAAAMRVALQVQGLTVEANEVFEGPLQFDDLAVSSGVGREAATGLQLDLDHVQLRNTDMDLAFQGDWRELGGGVAGLIDLEGRFERAELSAIVRYLPAIVDDDAREWLRHGLLAGRLVEAPLRLQGDLVHFPFGERPESGDFIVGGPVQGAVIDYAPASVQGVPGWPRLEELHGHAQLHRGDLTIRADTMRMRPGGEIIELRNVDARIPDIEQNSILSVEGVGEAQAAAFLSLMRESPLGELLDGMFDQAQGGGRWEVPIVLRIPLMDTDASQVKGELRFDQGALRLSDSFPGLSGLNGSLSFSEQHLSVQGLKGRVLGGPVTITGGVGQGQKGLVFEGGLSAAALDDYLEGRLAGMLEGSTSYRLALQRSPTGAFGMQLESPLEGLAIHLPAPFSKPAAGRWPLRVDWTPPAGKGDAMLDVRLADELTARFLHRDGAGKGAHFFHAGSLSLRGKAELPAQGLAVDVQAPRVDIDAWREVAGSLAGEGEAAATSIFPPLRDLRLQADRASVLGMELNRLTFTARRPEGDRWRVDVSSTETAGTLFWQARRGRIEGEVDAHFQRLALGAEDSGQTGKNKAEDEPSFNLDDDIDFPAIRLKVDRLRLYGRDIGGLSVVGLNDVQGRSWRLEQLQVTSPHASFKGSGVWQLDGPKRGLTIQADALFDDLGAYLEQAGFTDLMHGGHGQVQGVIEWRDLPWSFERAGLQGDLSVDLVKGRFVNVGSRSARLLELLSLQSVQRLASLNWNPGGLLQQGFPFDTLQGHIKLENGILHSENYRVTGPVATIVIAGDVDLPREVLDLYAVVVPNLDVSGAAIAAGIAVNPIVGVGAFLTQWLLKNPMSKAMTVEYRVKGDFDSPDIQAVNSSGQNQ